jgi:hypothetical protein
MASTIIYKSNLIDATVVGSAFLFKNFPLVFGPIKILVYCKTASQITIPPTISVGTNAQDYDNIIPATVLTGLVETDQTFEIEVPQLSHIVAANTDIFINVAIGSTGASQTISINLEGEAV